MRFTVGHSCVTASISDTKINEMLTNHTSLLVAFWGEIKDFFFNTGEKNALKCLSELCNPKPNLTSSEVKKIFFELRRLASPAYKDIFYYKPSTDGVFTDDMFIGDEIDESSINGKLYIQDSNGFVLLSAEIRGELFEYTILNQSFAFDIPEQEYATKTQDLSISYQNPNQEPHSQYFKRVKEGYCFLSYENNNFNFNFNAVSEKVTNYVKSNVNDENHYSGWMKEEKITYISAFINQVIDDEIISKSTKLKIKLNKDEVFSFVKKELGILSLQLDIRCAQSSIKQVITSLMDRDELPFCDFIKKCSEDKTIKRSITTEMNNAMSSYVFEKLFMDEIKLPVNWIHVIRNSVRNKINEIICSDEAVLVSETQSC